ncbi:hypothetical protein ASC80_03490 [Afipia sp. Root123D2]|nr:hypothetical protein ASC80_03490 [Afipia sp. Root123D2]
MRVFVCVCLTMIGLRATMAEDEFVASVHLRGGFDTNPQFLPGPNSGRTAFIGTDAALAAGTKQDGYSYGVVAEAGTTQYSNSDVVPSMSGKVVLRGLLGDDNANVSSTTTIGDTNSYNLRSSDLIQTSKGEVRVGSFKLFASAEGARSSLNQTNVIFQDFLPNPQQYLRGTVIPGVSFVKDKFEIGASVNLSVRRYLEEFDDFGYRRDNERVQPFLFAKYGSADFSAFGAISYLRGTWHDVDFTNVREVLFDTNLTWRIAPFTIDLKAARSAGETTFPISPITIDTIYSGKVAWQVDPKWTLTAAAGYAITKYLDSPFKAQTATYGVGLSHDLGNGYALGLDLTRAQGTLISGDKADGTIISSSITKKFSPFAKDETDSRAMPVLASKG